MSFAHITREGDAAPAHAPWYQKDISAAVTPQTRQMLETYSHIPPADVEPSIAEARRKAYDAAPYPSVGQITWLNPYILWLPTYQDILQTVKAGASILDVGCMVAPDLRRLAYDGAPTETMYGCDIEERFFDVGYDFYRDRETFKGRFFKADVEQLDQYGEMQKLLRSLDIIYCAKLLHLFDRDAQKQRIKDLLQYIRPQAGSLFVVSQNGYMGSPTFDRPPSMGRPGGKLWMADADGWTELWRELEEETSTKWEVNCRLFDLRTIGMHKDDGSEYKRLTGYCLQATMTLTDAGNLANIS